MQPLYDSEPKTYTWERALDLLMTQVSPAQPPPKPEAEPAPELTPPTPPKPRPQPWPQPELQFVLLEHVAGRRTRTRTPVRAMTCPLHRALRPHLPERGRTYRSPSCRSAVSRPKWSPPGASRTLTPPRWHSRSCSLCASRSRAPTARDGFAPISPRRHRSSPRRMGWGVPSVELVKLLSVAFVVCVAARLPLTRKCCSSAAGGVGVWEVPSVSVRQQRVDPNHGGRSATVRR